MRLGQLARKLALRPSEIVEFLAKQNIQIEDGFNTRLEDHHTNLVMHNFSPEIAGLQIEVPIVKPEPLQEIPLLSDSSLPQINEPIVASLETDEEFAGDQKEVIKAQKVSLSGLKVIGKIDLPETTKKEVQSDPVIASENSSEGTPEPGKPAPEVRKHEQKPRKQLQRSVKNPIALQREREVEAEKKKREQDAEREKERRTRNYYNKVRLSPPTKAVKLVDEPVMQMSAEELEEAPKTWFGRLIKWLTKA